MRVVSVNSVRVYQIISLNRISEPLSCILAESDSESVPNSSPAKLAQNARAVRVKTLEEIRLERIQAESAAFYSYPEPLQLHTSISTNILSLNKPSNDLRARLGGYGDFNKQFVTTKKANNKNSNKMDFEILSLEQIRKRKREAVTRAVEEPAVKPKKLRIESTSDTETLPKAVRIKKRSQSFDSEESQTKKKEIPQKPIISSTEESEMCVTSSSSLPSLPLRRRRRPTNIERVKRTKPKLVRPILSTKNNIDNSPSTRIPDLVADCKSVDDSVESTNILEEETVQNISNLEDESFLLADSDNDDNSSVSLADAEEILQGLDDEILND